MKTVIYKLFIPTVKKLDDGSYEVTITTGIKDRQGQVVLSEGGQFQNYMKNPVVLWAHKYADPPIARAKMLSSEPGAVSAIFEFPPLGIYPFADTIHGLWDAQYINASSIGISPLEWANKETISKWELLEWSVVPIPANPDALRRMQEEGVPENLFDLLDHKEATLDLPDDLETKEGRVLSKKNRQLVGEAVKALQALLRASEPNARDNEPANNTDDNEHGDNDDQSKRDKLMADIGAGLSRIREAYHG